MELTIYNNFNKKSNSTKQPTGGTVHNVKLKNGTSVQNPIFLIQGVDLNANYCKWNNRFYFINDIVLGNNNIYELTCSTDYLATYKAQIAAANTFVERSATNYNNYINDAFLSQEQKATTTSCTTTAISEFDSTGCYLVRIIGGGGSDTGISTFVLNKGELSQVMDFAFSEGSYGDEVADAVTKTFFNPFQYIVSIMWLPLAYSIVADGGTSATVKLGWWNTQVSAVLLGHLGITINIDVNLPTTHFNDWRDWNPAYSQYNLYLPGSGLHAINGIDVAGMTIELGIDFITGRAKYITKRSDNVSMTGNFDCQLGVPIQIGQLATDLVGSAGSAMSAVGNAIAGNYAGAAVSAFSAVANFIQPTASINGSIGNASSLRDIPDIVLSRISYGSADYPTTVAGRPCCKNLQLGSLSGYIKCGNASIDIAGLSGDKEAVNSMLNSGFYME